MSNSDVTFYSDKQPSATPHLPSGTAKKLRYALKLYQANLDIQALQKAYAHYCHQEAKLKAKILRTPNIAKSVSTFNLAPSGRYNRYLGSLGGTSDREAIEADWNAVGEFLSCAKIKSLLESNKPE